VGRAGRHAAICLGGHLLCLLSHAAAGLESWATPSLMKRWEYGIGCLVLTTKIGTSQSLLDKLGEPVRPGWCLPDSCRLQRASVFISDANKDKEEELCSDELTVGAEERQRRLVRRRGRGRARWVGVAQAPRRSAGPALASWARAVARLWQGKERGW